MTAAVLAFGTMATNGNAEEASNGGHGNAPQPFTTDSTSECYRAVGRGIYDQETNRTYQVYLRDAVTPWIIAYDHGKGEWSEPVRISSETYGVDDHFYPSMWINSRGYIHVVWGAHGSSFKHLATKEPYDITSWEKLREIGRGCYAQPIATDGGRVVYLFLTQYGPRRLVLYKSEDGGDTFGPQRPVIGPGYGGKGRGIYVGNIKHQPATDSGPEQFHIPWTFFHRDGSLHVGGRQHPVHYALFNAETGRVYNAEGEDLGESLKFPDGWEATLVSQPRQEAQFMEYIPNTGVTKQGDPFVIWTELNAVTGEERHTMFHTYFGIYNPDKEDWTVSKIHEEPLPQPGAVGRAYDVDVTDNGTINMYFPTGKTVKLLTSEDSGQTWEEQTIYRAPSLELESVYFAALIDSARMGSDAARHPDYQLTFKQHFGPRSARGQSTAQFAWGEDGMLNP